MDGLVRKEFPICLPFPPPSQGRDSAAISLRQRPFIGEGIGALVWRIRCSISNARPKGHGHGTELQGYNSTDLRVPGRATRSWRDARGSAASGPVFGLPDDPRRGPPHTRQRLWRRFPAGRFPQKTRCLSALAHVSEALRPAPDMCLRAPPKPSPHPRQKDTRRVKIAVPSSRRSPQVQHVSLLKHQSINKIQTQSPNARYGWARALPPRRKD